MLAESSLPVDRSEIIHSKAGRFAYLKMRSMTLLESGESNGNISFEKIFSGNLDIKGTSKLTMEDVAFLVCRGGWPIATYLSGKNIVSSY